MKRVLFTAKVNAYQTFEIEVDDNEYEQLLYADSISGQNLADYIENNLSQKIEWHEIEAEGLESVSICE